METELSATEVAPKRRARRRVPRVSVYARHTSECKFFGREGKKSDHTKTACGCPKLIVWYDGKLHREAAGTDRAEAERKARAKTEYFEQVAEAAAKGVPAPAPPITEAALSLDDAIVGFLKYVRKAKKPITEKRYRMLDGALKEFNSHCAARSLFKLAEVKTRDCFDFTTGLSEELHQNTRSKKSSTVKRFLKWCVGMDMLARSPFTDECKVEKAAVTQKPKALDDGQFAQLLATVPLVKGKTTDEQRRKLRSLALLMRYCGCAIKDAVNYERSRFTDDGDGFYSVTLNRLKTGKPAIGSLRADIARDILAGCNQSGRYLFTDKPLHTFGEKQMDNFVSEWNRLFKKLGDAAAITDENGEQLKVRSHWCRHSFIAWAIMSGLAASDVAALAGDTEMTIANSYSVFFAARQKNLTQRMKAALTAAAEQTLTAAVGR